MTSQNIVSELAIVCAGANTRAAMIQYHGKNKEKSMGYGKLWRTSDQLAGRLIREQIKSGQLIGIFMRRSTVHVMSLLGIMKTGAAFFTVNPQFSLTQVLYLLERTRTHCLLVDNASLIKMANFPFWACSKLKILHIQDGPMNKVHQAAVQKISSAVRFETVDFEGDQLVDTPVIVGSDLAMVLFTSGSTGAPKGVMISHQDLLNRASHEVEAYRLESTDRLLNLLTFSFDVGCNQLFSSLLAGATLVIVNSWLPRDIFQVIADYKITGISGVPFIWADLIAHDEQRFVETARGLKYITISGGDLTLPELERLALIAPTLNIYKTYGQTETFRSSMLMPADFARKKASVGKPIPGVDIEILNSKGEQALSGETGQIIHRGLGTMIGYLGDSKGTRNKKRINPFLSEHLNPEACVIYTGDQGKLDDEGYLYVLGRRDKMIKIKGNRVYPQEIVRQILSHEAVLEATAFGVKSKSGKTRIVTEVRLKPQARITESELKAHLVQHLPSFMVPAEVYFVDEFPRTASGKIKLSTVEAKYRE